MRATRLAEPIVLDGKLDDGVSARVEPVSGFVQQVPDEGAPATEPTDAWVFFDENDVLTHVGTTFDADTPTYSVPPLASSVED